MKFISVALFFALWLEFFYKFGATYDPSNFIGACVIYLIYLSLYFVFLKIFLRKKLIIAWLCSGVIGLMAEWFLMGNSPWGNPHAIQSGMFVFHAFYPVLALMFLQYERYKKALKRVCGIFIVFSVLSLLGFLFDSKDIRFAWFIWIPLLPYYASTIVILWRLRPKYRVKR